MADRNNTSESVDSQAPLHAVPESIQPQRPRQPPPPPAPTSISPQDSYSSRARADSRATSRPPPPPPVLHQPQQPVKDAVNAAFDSTPSAQLDPEVEKRLIEQVTEQVIKNLHLVNLSTAATPTSSTASQQAQPSLSTASRSPTQPSPTHTQSSTTESFPSHFTPPSPLQERDAYYKNSKASSPERAPSDAGSVYSKQSKESMRSYGSTQSNKDVDITPRASQPGMTGFTLKRSKTMAAPEMIASDTLSRRRGSSEMTARQLRRRDSRGSFDGASRSKPRPPKVDEVPVDNEEPTMLEQYWKPLFETDGSPTPRLGQFLRGLAQHLIDDYEPKGSLVIGPKKMLRFLEETKVGGEHYPWQTIFGGNMRFESISSMYRKLLCQHHFIQAQSQYHEAPAVPALTPHGFEQFMTCLIQAHPDTEFERLTKAVRDMPISNADDSKERFPKQLSRRLLPRQPVVQAEQRLISSLHHEPDLVPLERVERAMPPPPPSAPPQTTSAPPSAVPPQTAFPERERKPYSHTTQQSNAVDDDDLTSPPAIPIERERKPYFAKEGTGKQYEPEINAERERDRDRERERERERERDRERDRASREPSRPNQAPPGRPLRMNSGSGAVPQGSYNDGTGPDMPSSGRNAHRMSQPPPVNPSYSTPKASRRRSPTASGYRSAPMDINQIPASEYASNLRGPPRDRFTGDPDEDVLRYNDSRRAGGRNATFEDDYGGRPVPSRNAPPAPSAAYDSALYGSAGPTASSSGGRNSIPGGSEDRRRTWYPGMAGTDGYGSYSGGQNGDNYRGSSQY